ncbi:HAMP domain-containing histidine kinase [Dietzia sp. E1]|uniref:sensor histidine kinase n=1 Tax=Dietzia sp. E1 TaxID=328361 RepID=UPI0015FA7D95|nr:HAMP domain-containing sensor histidine kinase [Dietzia sp. E1]MBB1021496.1 HAMP domain-containing histidine kinase [Dietzia sp. E1]
MTQREALAPGVSRILRARSRQMLMLVVVVALLGPLMLFLQYQLAQRTSTVYTPVVDTTSRLVINMRWAQSDLRMDRVYAVPGAEDRLRALKDESGRALAELDRLVGDDTEFAPALARLTASSASWWSYADSIVGMEEGYSAADDPTARARFVSALADFSEMIASADSLHTLASDKRVEVRVLRTRVLVGGSAAAFAMTLVAALAIVRGTRRTAEEIVDPIEELAAVARIDTVGGRGTRARTDDGPAEVRALAEAFNTLLDTRDDYEAGREEQLRRLEELDRQKDAFVSTVSHELRTPLASIVGYTEMLCDGDGGELTSAQHRLVGVVQRNADRLRGLIEDLLILSRIEAQNLDIAHERLSLGEVVGNVTESLQPAADRAGLRFVEQVEPAEVIGDALQLERAVTNLVSNAIKFTPEGGSVTVGLTVDEHVATVTVADTGIGIPEAEQEHLGTRFFRSSTAQHRSIPGTGLGVSIVQAIAEAHGGDLDFDSVEDEGTTFRLTVPLWSAGAGSAAP